MNEETSKAPTPAYIPYKTFYKFINGLQSTIVPNQIDKSIMLRMSGGDQSAMLGALKFLQLIDKTGKPSLELKQLIESNEDKRGPLLRAVLVRAYHFLFSGAINVEDTTTSQVQEAFHLQGVTGSTIVKCIAFFLSAAKAAGIQVSPHVKTPTMWRNTIKRPASSTMDFRNLDAGDETDELPPGTKKLKLPLPGKPDVVLLLPKSFSQEDWTFLKPILEAYISRMFEESAS